MYEKHASYLKEKEIALSKPDEFTPISLEVKQRIQREVNRKVMEGRLDQRSLEWEGWNPEVISCLHSALPHIIDFAESFIVDRIKEKIAAAPSSNVIETYEQLADFRKIEFEAYSWQHRSLIEGTINLINSPDVTVEQADLLLNLVFEEMVSSGAIGQYIRKYTIGITF